MYFHDKTKQFKIIIKENEKKHTLCIFKFKSFLICNNNFDAIQYSGFYINFSRFYIN